MKIALLVKITWSTDLPDNLLGRAAVDLAHALETIDGTGEEFRLESVEILP